MRHPADPRAAGCRRAHRSRLRQLQLLRRAEHVHRDEAVRAARGGQRSHPGPAAGRRSDPAATQAGAEGARLGHAIGRIAPGFKADLTLIDMNDPSWSPMNSAARQLVHVEAGRGVRHVMVDGTVVVRDRRLTTVDETRSTRR